MEYKHTHSSPSGDCQQTEVGLTQDTLYPPISLCLDLLPDLLGPLLKVDLRH